MDKFKLGDHIRVVSDYASWLDQGSERDQIFIVVQEISSDNHVFCPDSNTADLDAVNDWPNDFELVHRPTSFSLDYVPDGPNVDEPEEIIDIKLDNLTTYQVVSEASNGSSMMFKSPHMGAVMDPTFTTLPYILPAHQPDLGVYRPNLEDRKVGKVRVELVDHGFPLALREVAKVMTWAQTAKGYKDHDWQNLPNPEQSLGGATSRHCTDNIIQRMVEVKPAIECTDHESNILHKAHEAFGVLAQLELILRGVIK